MSQATLSNRPYTNSNLFSGHYLDERVQHRNEWDCDEEAQEALEKLQALYRDERELVAGYGEDSLIDNWIDEVLEILGFGTNVETTLPDSSGYVDILLFENTESRRRAAKIYLDTENTADLFDGGLGLLEAKQWDADFSQRFSERRPYRNASHQIKHYLERTPENIQWGILTDGKKWRLYGTKDYETQTYYEINLPQLIESGNLNAFKYFYVFFRPDAFRKHRETTFLDSVWSESETVAQQLGEDLQDNVFTALRVLGRGFAETNDLDINPEGDEELAELKEQSLVLLYRLMFVLYAEARGLIHPESSDSITEYEQNFSLDELRLKIHDEIGEIDDGFDTYSEHSTSMWSRLEDLFRLIDKGEEKLGIPPYNGGLFDQEKHDFLANHEVSNRYLAEVIYRISTTENSEGRYVLADYADLDTRHLGSVYEGLLEHQFRIAPEQYAAVAEDGGQVWEPATEVSVADAVEVVDPGDLYVVNDEGERKATGAYYTPDYVVTYIIEETVGPLIEEIKENLKEQGFQQGTHEYLGAFYRRVTNLKILDPAMGSGHFLTRATEYLAEQVMAEVRELEEATAFDEQRVRRDVAKECIYGVDLNGMAVELAKLSMWLETLAADQPLAFLDHHLKTGNSLIGSDVTEVLSNDTGDNNGQLTLKQALAHVRQETLGHVMDRMQELLEIDNETLEEVKSMEEIYEEIRTDPFYKRLFELTNVHTAEQFNTDVPEGSYERMARAIDDEDEWIAIQEESWFQTVQEIAREEAFFHWELEYPEVFFDEDGEKQEEAGFDAVIGNPPYLLLQGTDHQNKMKELYPDIFTGSNDLSHFFVRKGIEILNDQRRLGYVITRYWLEAHRSSALRKYILEEAPPSQIVEFGDLQIWPKVNVLAIITILEKGEREDAQIFIDNDENYSTAPEFIENIKSKTGHPSINMSLSTLDENPWNLRTLSAKDLWKKVEEKSLNLQEIAEISQGIKSGNNDAFTVTGDIIEDYSLEREGLLPLARAKDIRRYDVTSTRWVIYTDGKFNPSEYPHIMSYLEDYRKELESRSEAQNGIYPWWRLQRPHERELMKSPKKLLVPHYARENRFAYTTDGTVGMTDSFLIVPNEEYNVHFLAAVFNSKLINAHMSTFGKRKRAGYLSYAGNRLKKFPVPDIEDEQRIRISNDARDLIGVEEGQICVKGADKENGEEGFDPYVILSTLAENIGEYISQKKRLNFELLDHLGSYNDGQSLKEIGFPQPPEGAANSILTDTAANRENLRVGSIEIVRESSSSLEIHLSARYKPENEDSHETDRWGYIETELLPALRISDLSEIEADLVEAFVPVAVNEAGGFANFRETATKTNSLVDRLRKLTLPAVTDVCDELESYLKTKARGEELQRNIEKTDQLIDQIVYELYGLTDDEIEIVEDTVKQ